MKPRIAGGVLLALFASIYFTPVTKGTAAAIALRDAVPRYQQLGTEYFTEPRLARVYAKHWYLTATPTESQHEAFVAALKEATRDFTEVDVFLLAHGNEYVRWVEELDVPSRERIRLVYDTGGGSAAKGPRWMRLGVKAFVGHPGGNIAPLFYVQFLPRWLRGEPLESAVADANADTHASMVSATGRATARVTQWVTGAPVDTKALWAGTEAQVFTQPDAGK